MSQKIKIKKGMTVKNVENEIFRKMSFHEKIKLAFDFSAVGRDLELIEGTPIPNSYLMQWMKWNKVKNWRKFYIGMQDALREERIEKFKMGENSLYK